jgi:hypothetical protein
MTVDSREIGFAGIAVVDFKLGDKIAIEAISVTQDSCDLSGAWLLKIGEEEKLSTILENKLVIVLGEENAARSWPVIQATSRVAIDDFLTEAREEVLTALSLFQEFNAKNLQEYDAYMKIKPTERKLLPKVTKKNLVEPNFSAWPDSIDLEISKQELERLGKLSSINGTPDDMKRVLAASRLLQILIYMWKNDEVERLNRQYVIGSDAKSTILPAIWLEKLFTKAI